MNVNDYFAKHMGVLKVKFDDNPDELEFRPTLKHKRELLWLMQKSQKGEYGQAELDKQYDVLSSIIQTSYPDLSKEQVENFLMEKDSDFLAELYVGFGWVEPDFKEKLKKKTLEQKESLAKTSEESN